MPYSIKSSIEKYPQLADLLYAVLFGVLSIGLGELKFAIPGIEGGATDFREIPLIISVLYIKRPLYLIIPCLITAFTTPAEGSHITTFVMHFFTLLPFWYFYKYITSLNNTVMYKGLIFSLTVVVYFVVFIIPIMLVSDKLLGINTSEFLPYYITILSSVKFELFATAIITALYFVQFEVRKNLILYQQDLELIVERRTRELADSNSKLSTMNDELIANSKEIKSMNENLDTLVKIRSNRIEKQLQMLHQYAHMNSHQVRAPLARVLGLLEIIKLQKSVSSKDKIVKDLCDSGLELDKVVKDMNRLLENDIEDE